MKALVATAHSNLYLFNIYLNEPMYKQIESRGFVKEDDRLYVYVAALPSGKSIVAPRTFSRKGWPKPKRVALGRIPNSSLYDYRANAGHLLFDNFGENVKKWGASICDQRWTNEFVPGHTVLVIDEPAVYKEPRMFRKYRGRTAQDLGVPLQTVATSKIGEKYPDIHAKLEVDKQETPPQKPTGIILTVELPDGSKLIVEGMKYARLMEEQARWREMGLQIKVQDE